MPKSKKAIKIVLWLFRVLTAIIVFSVIGFLLWRIFIHAYIPNDMKGLSVNQNIAEAYEKNDGELTLLPHSHGTDGFYMARIRKAWL